jgi:hypothetical protein
MRRNRSGRLVHLLGIWLTVAPEAATSEMTGRPPLPCSLDSIHLDSICRCGGAGASLPGGAQERDQVAAPRSLWIPTAGADPELLQMDDDDATVGSTTSCCFSRRTTTARGPARLPAKLQRRLNPTAEEEATTRAEVKRRTGGRGRRGERRRGAHLSARWGLVVLPAQPRGGQNHTVAMRLVGHDDHACLVVQD